MSEIPPELKEKYKESKQRFEEVAFEVIPHAMDALHQAFKQHTPTDMKTTGFYGHVMQHTCSFIAADCLKTIEDTYWLMETLKSSDMAHLADHVMKGESLESIKGYFWEAVKRHAEQNLEIMRKVDKESAN